MTSHVHLWNFFNYPFDAQEMHLPLHIKRSASWDNCIDSLVHLDLVKDHVLEVAAEYALSSKLTQVDARYGHNPLCDLDAECEPSLDICEFIIRLDRKPLKYVVQTLLLETVTTLAGLLGLSINPTAPPLFGGRCSILIVAMLININKANHEPPNIGAQNELLLVDFFVLVNVVFLMLSLMISVVIHRHLLNDGTREHGYLIDEMLRKWSLATYLFTCLCFLLFLMAPRYHIKSLAILCLVLGGLSLVGVGCW